MGYGMAQVPGKELRAKPCAEAHGMGKRGILHPPDVCSLHTAQVGLVSPAVVL